jgi:hypothetical protein
VGNKEAWHVLSKYVSGSKLPNQAGELKPKARASAFNPCPLSGLAEVLTGETASDEVNGFEFGFGEVPDIRVLGDSWPAPFESPAAPVIDFDLPPALKPGAVEAKIDAADS